MSLFLGILVVLLLFAVVGLSVGVFYLYKHPQEIGVIPYNIYGAKNGVIAPGKLAQGVLTQADNFVQTTAITDITKETSQWYLVPSEKQILFQNVSTKEFITINSTTLVPTMTSSMTDATPFIWQINQVDGGNYFVYHNTTVTCVGNYFYLSFANIDTSVAILCLSSSPSGFLWGVAPVVASLVG